MSQSLHTSDTMSRPSINRGFSETLLAAVLAMAVVIALAVGLARDARGELIGDYDLTQGATLSPQNLAVGLDDLSFLPASPTSTFNGTGWHWDSVGSPGATVSADVDDGFGNFTIGLRFALGQVSGFNRVILFNATDDRGLYVDDGSFTLFGSPITGGSIGLDETVDVVITRSNVGMMPVNVYTIDYSGPTPEATQIGATFNDTFGIFTFGTLAQFFRDDNGGTEFSPSGTASLIRIWDAPLSGVELDSSMVPEPATIALLAVAGSGALLCLHRRRRRLR